MYGEIGHWRGTLPACRICYGISRDTRAKHYRPDIE